MFSARSCAKQMICSAFASRSAFCFCLLHEEDLLFFAAAGLPCHSKCGGGCLTWHADTMSLICITRLPLLRRMHFWSCCGKLLCIRFFFQDSVSPSTRLRILGILKRGECFAPHPPFACQREVPQVRCGNSCEFNIIYNLISESMRHDARSKHRKLITRRMNTSCRK